MEKSSTSKTQKIIIWFIIVAMTVGTLGAYFIVIVENENQKRDTEQQAKLQEEYRKMQEEEAKKTKEPLEGYVAAAFDPASVTSVQVEELKAGAGEKTASKNSTIVVNYFGWTSDGAIFDSTKKSGQTTPATIALTQVIPGWQEGLKGAKAGSVRKITIPTAKAYGEDAASQGRPAGPLQFVVEVKEIQQ